MLPKYRISKNTKIDFLVKVFLLADFGALHCQTVIKFEATIAVDFSTISAIKYTACWR